MKAEPVALPTEEQQEKSGPGWAGTILSGTAGGVLGGWGAHSYLSRKGGGATSELTQKYDRAKTLLDFLEEEAKKPNASFEAVETEAKKYVKDESIIAELRDLFDKSKLAAPMRVPGSGLDVKLKNAQDLISPQTSKILKFAGQDFSKELYDHAKQNLPFSKTQEKLHDAIAKHIHPEMEELFNLTKSEATTSVPESAARLTQLKEKYASLLGDIEEVIVTSATQGKTYPEIKGMLHSHFHQTISKAAQPHHELFSLTADFMKRLENSHLVYEAIGARVGVNSKLADAIELPSLSHASGLSKGKATAAVFTATAIGAGISAVGYRAVKSWLSKETPANQNFAERVEESKAASAPRTRG